MKKILIVDDDENIRIFLSCIFQNLCELKIAENGQIAHEMVKQGNFDIVITDYNMPPGMDGIQLAEKIREEKPNTYIILLTATDKKNIENNSKINFINCIFSKPFNVNELITALRLNV